MGNERPALEVFFCSAPQSDQRTGIAVESWDYWCQQDCELYLLSPQTVGCSLTDFNRRRREAADGAAKGDFYILTDDDCIPKVPFPYLVKRAVEVMRKRTEFAILSLWPIEATINRWTPENYEIYEDLEVSEHVSVGGCRVVRKGSQFCWPKSQTKGYDLVQADHLRLIGKRVGYFQHLRMNHLGEGKSDLWRMSEAEHLHPA